MEGWLSVDEDDIGIYVYEFGCEPGFVIPLENLYDLDKMSKKLARIYIEELRKLTNYIERTFEEEM